MIDIITLSLTILRIKYSLFTVYNFIGILMWVKFTFDVNVLGTKRLGTINVTITA